MYKGSITQGISFTNVIAPVMWYSTFTSRIWHMYKWMSNNYSEMPYLFPGHGHVLHQLDDGVGHKLECAQIDTLVVTELAISHVPVVCNNLAHMLWRHVLLVTVDHP